MKRSYISAMKQARRQLLKARMCLEYLNRGGKQFDFCASGDSFGIGDIARELAKIEKIWFQK